MATDMTQDILLKLPKELAQRIERAAAESHRSLDSVVTEILDISLPRLRKRLPISPEELEAKFRDTPTSELQKMTQRWFPEDKTRRIQELTELSGEQTLSETQEAELEDLLDQVTINAAEGAAARWLLKRTKTK